MAYIVNLTIILSLLSACKYVTSLRYGAAFRKPEFNDSSGDIDEFQNVTKVLKCSVLCSHTLTCIHFSFNKLQKRCRLHKKIFFSGSVDGINDGWEFYAYGEACPVDRGFLHDRQNNLCVLVSELKFYAIEGKQFCQKINSNLISLETAEKQDRFDTFLAKLPETFITGRVRIGLEYTDSKWTWSSGSPLTDDRWMENEPNCGTDCYCGSVTMKGGWYDNFKEDIQKCSDRRSYSVCEVSSLS